jgi:hypothetical protein
MCSIFPYKPNPSQKELLATASYDGSHIHATFIYVYLTVRPANWVQNNFGFHES